MSALSTFKKLAIIGLMATSLAACSNDQDKNGAGGFGGMGGAGGFGNGAYGPPGSKQEFASVAVGDRVFFDTDQTDLNMEGRAIIDRQAQWLNQYTKYTATIEGHADERGTREYNLALGARRAQSVQEYLVSKGVNPNRLRTISYGKERPVSVCDDISCWSKNRRAVTALSGN